MIETPTDAEYLESRGWTFEGIKPDADGGLMFLVVAPGYGIQWSTPEDIAEFAELEREEEAWRAARKEQGESGL